jgi:PmbA protein
MWFEGGELAFPVSEVTVAGDLISMFRRARPGSDLDVRSSVSSPSLLIEDLALAGY